MNPEVKDPAVGEKVTPAMRYYFLLKNNELINITSSYFTRKTFHFTQAISKNRSLKMFREWFEVRVADMVLDIAGEPLRLG